MTDGPSNPRRSAALQAAVGALAVVFALPTLLYPFGRDQGLFEYVGRGWLDGWLPYVHAWDQKPPGIHVVYALGAALFGAQMWSVRLFEILVVLGQAVVASRLVAGPGAPPLRHVGAAAALIAAFHYAAFDFWHTAQAEPWEALLILAAAVAADGPYRPSRAAACGALGAAAAWFKPPVLPVALVVGAWLLVSAWRRGGARDVVGATAVAVASGVGLIGIGLLPWLVTGTVDVFIDVVIRYNAAYAANKSASVLTLPEFLVFGGRWLVPYTALTLAGLWVARADRAALERGAWLAALAGAAGASVALQGKFYGYHWLVVVAPTATAAVWALTALAPRSSPRVAAGLGVLALAAAFVAPPPWHQNKSWNYAKHWGNTVAYLRGRVDRAAFLDPYRARHMWRFHYGEVEALSARIAAVAQPGDTMCSVNYEPVFYTLTELRCPTRFCTRHAIGDSVVDYRVAEWTAEYERDLAANPPTFVVLRTRFPNDRRTWAAKGYRVLGESELYVVMHRR